MTRKRSRGTPYPSLWSATAEGSSGAMACYPCTRATAYRRLPGVGGRAHNVDLGRQGPRIESRLPRGAKGCTYKPEQTSVGVGDARSTRCNRRGLRKKASRQSPKPPALPLMTPCRDPQEAHPQSCRRPEASPIEHGFLLGRPDPEEHERSPHEGRHASYPQA